MPKLTQEKNLIIAVLILLFAAILRLPFADTYVLWGDEFSLERHGIWIVMDGQHRLVGTGATFEGLTHHSPFTSYIVALIILLFPDPGIARVFVGLLGILAVAISFAMLYRYFGRRAAWIGGLLIATMPLTIWWSRFVWNPNIGQVFLPLWFYTLFLAYYDGKRWSQVLHWLVLSANIQSQSALVYLLPISLVLFLWHLFFYSRRTQTILATLIGWLLFVLSLAPWIIGLRQYASEHPEGAETANMDSTLSALNWEGLRQVPMLFGRMIGATQFPASKLGWHPDPMGLWSSIPMNAVGWLVVALAVGGILWLSMKFFQAPKRNMICGFLAAMSIAPFGIIFFATPDQPITDHFFMPATFAGTFVVAIVLDRLWRISRKTAFFFLSLIVSAYILITFSHMLWQHQHGHEHPNGNLGTLSQQAEQFLAYGDLIVLPRDFHSDPNLSQRERFEVTELMWSWLIMSTRYPIEVVDTFGNFIVFPKAERVAIVGRANDATFEEWLGKGEAIGLYYPYQVMTLQADADMNLNQFGKLMRIMTTFHSPSLCAGEAGTVSIVWEPLVYQPENDYNFSVRLADAHGDTQAQVDVPTLYHEYWETDDWIMTHIDLPAASSEINEIRLILYNSNDAAGVDVLDAQGNPANYYVSLPLNCWE